jgi:hypothetical protein
MTRGFTTERFKDTEVDATLLTSHGGNDMLSHTMERKR